MCTIGHEDSLTVLQTDMDAYDRGQRLTLELQGSSTDSRWITPRLRVRLSASYVPRFGQLKPTITVVTTDTD